MRQICFHNHNDKEFLEMRSLNLDQLRTLTEVVACGSFSAAARRLNLTQPAVSLQIRELEARFGVRLIERLGKQAHATVPGQQLVDAAQRILLECDAVDALMRRFRKGWLGRVRVGTMLTTLTYRLPPVLSRLRTDHPGIDLIVNNMPTQDAVANVTENKLDLGLVALPVDDKQLRVTPVLDEMLVAILPRTMSDIPDWVTPDYAVEQTLLIEHTRSSGYPLVMGWLRQAPLVREPAPIGTVEALKIAVASKLGMALVPEVAVAKHSSDFVVRPLRPTLSRTLALIEHRNKPNEPALEIVRNALLALGANDTSAPNRRRRPGRIKPSAPLP
jgi:DNA-binding transcriptional LysR family regulator